MIVDELKKSILNVAIHGNLVQNVDSDVYYLKELKKEFSNSGIRIKKEKSLEELKFSIPKFWKWTRLEELATVYGRIGFRGYTTTDLVKPGLGAITLSPSNIIKDEMNYESCTYISWDKYEESPEIKINNGDILLVKTGSSYGKNAIVKNLPQQATINPQFAVIKNIICNTSYLFYALNSDLAKQQYERFVIGTSIPTFSQSKINSLLIPLPPIEEQQRIVDKVEELFSKLDEIKPIEDELNKLKLEFPNDMKKSILKDAFDGKYSMLSFNNWSTDKLINACDEICTGNSISENIKKTKYTNLKDGYNYIGTKDLNFDHSFEYENGIKIPFEERNFKYAFAGDILLCIEGGSAGKKIGILNEKVCYGNKLCKFSSSKLNSKFLYYYLQSPQFVKNFYDNISGIIGGVSINKIKTIEISFPPIEEQKRIVDRLEQLLPLCDDIEKLVEES